MKDKIIKYGQNHRFTSITTFSVPFSLTDINNKIIFTDNSKDNLIRQAFRFHLSGNISKASICYEYFLSQGYSDPRVFVNYGEICNQNNKRERAIRLYKDSIKEFPDNPDAYSNLAAILIDLGDLNEAERYAIQAIKINPEYSTGYCNLANICKMLGKLKDAENYARIAINLNPEFVQANSNLATILIELDKLKEAEKYARKAIYINPNYAIAHSNLANILRDTGRLVEAETAIRKAITIDPNYANAFVNLSTILICLDKLEEAMNASLKAIEINPKIGQAYYNLAIVYINLGKLKESENLLYKAIELNSSLAKSYYVLSTLKDSYKNKIWQESILSEKIVNSKNVDELVNIYFARANIYHKNKIFKDSMKYLKKANDLKLNKFASNASSVIKKSQDLYLKTQTPNTTNNNQESLFQSIFIVGMPRSGTTLLESIIAMSDDVLALGENNILEESFMDASIAVDYSNLNEIYSSKVIKLINSNSALTNKWLYNYQYTGLIANYISNVKIIHCFRNPLDNILSIYRAHFAKGNEYSSSLVDSANVYLDQDNIMSDYKKLYRSNIYDLDYDSLVKNPEIIIKDLISWLGWVWNDSYLYPHLNSRSISTASNVQARSPINSKSVGGWKNYREILKPAIDIISASEKYKDLFFN